MSITMEHETNITRSGPGAARSGADGHCSRGQTAGSLAMLRAAAADSYPDNRNLLDLTPRGTA